MEANFHHHVMSIFMDFPSSVKISIIPDDFSVDPPAKDNKSREKKYL